jgi:dihydroorotate dehydrogenase electron transfer subunit
MTPPGLQARTPRLHRDQFRTEVIENVPLCREHFRLVLALAQFPPTEPGQFIQIACRDMEADYGAASKTEAEWGMGQPLEVAGEELRGPLALLRRPFSLAGRRDTGNAVQLDIIHRVVGVGTDWMSRLRPGDAVDVLGPLGNRFDLPPPDSLALLVGGGVGIPPMIYLAEKLGKSRRPAVVFSGALTRDLLPLTIAPDVPAPGADSARPLMNVGEFSRHGIPAVLSTDDGSYGFRGFVTQALEKYLEGSGFGVQGSVKEGSHLPLLNPAPRTLNPIIYTCGPEPMMKRVAAIAAERRLDCQVAVERAMACGMGTCQSCCIRVRKPDPAQVPLPGREWCYRLACTDGPVFRGRDLLW